MLEWKQYPLSIRLIKDGWELDVWQDIHGWRYTAQREGVYENHGENYPTQNEACEAALKAANI